MDILEDIRTKFILRARLHDDEASIVLKGHLLSEYLLNRIIDEKVPSSNKIKKVTYYRKLKIMEEKDFLTPEIIKNLCLLNSFRNKLVHKLNITIEAKDMIFYKDNKTKILIKPKKGRYPQRYYLRLLCHGILTQLINCMLLKLRIDPRWLNDKA